VANSSVAIFLGSPPPPPKVPRKKKNGFPGGPEGGRGVGFFPEAWVFPKTTKIRILPEFSGAPFRKRWGGARFLTTRNGPKPAPNPNIQVPPRLLAAERRPRIRFQARHGNNGVPGDRVAACPSSKIDRLIDRGPRSLSQPKSRGLCMKSQSFVFEPSNKCSAVCVAGCNRRVHGPR